MVLSVIYNVLTFNVTFYKIHRGSFNYILDSIIKNIKSIFMNIEGYISNIQLKYMANYI